MILTDYIFLIFFFPIFVTVYFLFRKRISLQNLVIIVFSLIFYASFGIKNTLILVLPLVVDYFAAIMVGKSRSHFWRKFLMILVVLGNLALLGFFKYYPKTALVPLGISFITFQRISYIVDVFRRITKPERNFWRYATYACLFPHLLSGPIVRFAQIKKQLFKRKISFLTVFFGTKLLIVGFAFKILVADQLFLTEKLFTADILGLHFLGVIFLLVIFSMRIYFDFMGYSLMAIGLAKIIGFDFPINFDSPYQSASVTEFWRRWNITLSFWVRDYLYIPLGGNRLGKIRTSVNLLVMMLLVGLWHGAGISFVIWGGLHGLFLVWERFFGVGLGWTGRLRTFALVSIAWVPFMFTDVGALERSARTIFLLSPPRLNDKLGFGLLVSLPALFFALVWAFRFREAKLCEARPTLRKILFLATLFLVTLGVSLINTGVPFIYFQF